MSKIKEGICKGLNNLGNESLYPMMETLKELGWDVMNNPSNMKIHIEIIDKLENIFTFLYNCKHSTIGMYHEELHFSLYESIRLLNIRSIPENQLFEELLVRDTNFKMVGFSERFKNFLQNSMEGLKSSLELYTDTYNLWKNNEQDLITNKVQYDISDKILQKIAKQYTEIPENQSQVRHSFSDRIYKQILKNELFNPQQVSYASELIYQRYKDQFIENTISKFNHFSCDKQDYTTLIANIWNLVNNLDDISYLKNLINEIAGLGVIKNNKELREYLGKTLFITDNYLDHSAILEVYDKIHKLLDFKPELASMAQDKISSQIFHNIKADFSQKIYNNDSLIARYLPVHGRGIKNTQEVLERVINEGVLPYLQKNNALDKYIRHSIKQNNWRL